MITIPAGVRVLLATRPVDFRNYAECLVMRSARPDASITAVYPPTPLRIISASSGGLQHGDERVGRLELSSS